jgi:hypothetical protein
VPVDAALTLLGTYPTLVAARRALDLLEDEGIRATGANELVATQLGGGYGAACYEVWVATEDLDRAREVLTAPAPDEPDEVADAELRELEEIQWARRTYLLSLWGILVLPVWMAVVVRATSSPAAEIRSPVARHWIDEARWFSYVGLVLHVTVILCVAAPG